MSPSSSSRRQVPRQLHKGQQSRDTRFHHCVTISCQPLAYFHSFKNTFNHYSGSPHPVSCLQYEFVFNLPETKSLKTFMVNGCFALKSERRGGARRPVWRGTEGPTCKQTTESSHASLPYLHRSFLFLYLIGALELVRMQITQLHLILYINLLFYEGIRVMARLLNH